MKRVNWKIKFVLTNCLEKGVVHYLFFLRLIIKINQMKYKQYKMSTWALEDRPSYKLVSKGLQVLSDSEILSVIIGAGTKTENSIEIAKKILSYANNNLDELAKKSISELSKFPGIGMITATKIVSSFELGRRRNFSNILIKDQIKSSQDVYNIMASKLRDLSHEEFWILLMNRANRVIDTICISKGGTTGTVIDTKIILNKAITKLASAIILSHNHPSGSINPSQADKNITEKIGKACHIMDINLLDHVIIANDRYFSFGDEGLINQ